MTNDRRRRRVVLRASSFGFDSSFWFRHWSFATRGQSARPRVESTPRGPAVSSADMPPATPPAPGSLSRRRFLRTATAAGAALAASSLLPPVAAAQQAPGGSFRGERPPAPPQGVSVLPPAGRIP